VFSNSYSRGAIIKFPHPRRTKEITSKKTNIKVHRTRFTREFSGTRQGQKQRLKGLFIRVTASKLITKPLLAKEVPIQPQTLEWLHTALMNPLKEIPKVVWCPKPPAGREEEEND
jgi:hypothetical protein